MLMHESCKGCYYRKHITRTEYACHYSIIEDSCRPCPAENCTAKLVLSKEEAAAKDIEYQNKMFNFKRSVYYRRYY